MRRLKMPPKKSNKPYSYRDYSLNYKGWILMNVYGERIKMTYPLYKNLKEWSKRYGLSLINTFE